MRAASAPSMNTLASLHGSELLRTLASATAKRLRMSDLAARLTLTPSGVTRLVERLEADGSVTRLRDDADRRVVHAHLTARGTARLVAGAETYSATIRALLSERFSDEELHHLSRALRMPSTTTGGCHQSAHRPLIPARRYRATATTVRSLER
jgi:DNA-binding MarR family transcriptional regulator